MPEAIIETAIGLFFVFLIMSMASSQIVEWVATLRRWRASSLEKTIRAMLTDPGEQAKLDAGALMLSQKLYEHPLIASLAPPGSKPSYIPAGKFTLALFDVILTAGSDTSTIGRARLGLEQIKNNLLAALPATAGPELLALIADIQVLIEAARAGGHSEDVIAGLSLSPRLNDELKRYLERYSISPQSFNALIQSVTTDGDIQLAQLRIGVAHLAQLRPELSQLITSLFTGLDTYASHGESQLAVARRNVEQWFDEAMDRAGGWYKKHITLWLGLIGLILALALNVDSLNIATTLWRDPTLRQNVLQQAQKYQLTQNTDGTPITNADQAAKAIRDLNTTLGQDLHLPIGWRTEPVQLTAGQVCTWLPVRAGDVWGIPEAQGCMQLADAAPNPNANPFGKLVGFIITAAAISLGAPFWFDLLSKLINLRGSGSVPATSQQNANQN